MFFSYIERLLTKTEHLSYGAMYQFKYVSYSQKRCDLPTALTHHMFRRQVTQLIRERIMFNVLQWSFVFYNYFNITTHI